MVDTVVDCSLIVVDRGVVAASAANGFAAAVAALSVDWLVDGCCCGCCDASGAAVDDDDGVAAGAGGGGGGNRADIIVYCVVKANAASTNS